MEINLIRKTIIMLESGLSLVQLAGLYTFSSKSLEQYTKKK